MRILCVVLAVLFLAACSQTPHYANQQRLVPDADYMSKVEKEARTGRAAPIGVIWVNPPLVRHNLQAASDIQQP